MHASDILAGRKASTANAILALHGLDCELMRPINSFSQLSAVTADESDYAVASGNRERAEARHERRTKEALAEVVAPDPRCALRRQLVDLLTSRGIARDMGSLMAVADLAALIRSDRAFQRAWQAAPSRRKNNQPHWDDVRSQLVAAGVYAPVKAGKE